MSNEDVSPTKKSSTDSTESGENSGPTSRPRKARSAKRAAKPSRSKASQEPTDSSKPSRRSKKPEPSTEMTSETSDASPRSRSRSFSKKPVPAAKAKPKTVAGLERDADRFAKAARSAKLKAIEMVRREKLRVQRALVKELMTEQKQLTRLGTANLKASKKALATLDSMERIDANFKAARAKKVD